MFRSGLQFWHIVVLVVVVALLFGANRLPGLAKSVGQSMKIFRDEVKDLRDPKDDAAGQPAERSATEPTEGSTPPKA